MPSAIALRPIFIGPREPLARLGEVRQAASEDRLPTAVLQSGQDVYLVNGVRMAAARSLHAGDTVRVPGRGLATVLQVDDGRFEMTTAVARAVEAGEAALAAGDAAAGESAFLEAVNLVQDADEAMLVARHGAAAGSEDARDAAVLRAVDLARDVRQTLDVAEATQQMGATDRAQLAYGQAIRRTTSRAWLLKIAASAEAAGYADLAREARNKAKGHSTGR